MLLIFKHLYFTYSARSAHVKCVEVISEIVCT
jgi:hypothetical protein